MSTRQNLGFRLIEQRRRRFAAANSAPNTPTISAGTPTSSGVTLTGSAFSDTDVGDTHAASQWQVTTSADTGYAAPVISTGDDATNKTSYAATGLSASTDYIARVRYKDSAGNYSDWSASASFTTAAASTTIVSDTFTRADNASSLGSTESGTAGVLAWTPRVGTWGISGNAAYNASATANAYATVNSGVSNGTVEVTIGAIGFAETGLIFRYSGPSNFWRFKWTGVFHLLKGGDGTVVQSFAGSLTTGDVLSVSFSGSTIKMWLNGVQIGTTVTDATDSTNTSHGLSLGGDSNTKITTFRVTVP